MTSTLKTVTTLMIAVLGLLVNGCKEGGATGQKYHCPMHPTYVSDRPGDCPICNMKLVPIKEDKAPAKAMAPASAEETAHIKPGQYYCPMDIEFVTNSPGTCPECNMKLIQKQEGGASPEHDTMTNTVPGRIAVSLSPEKRQLIGLTLAKVEKRQMNSVVRTTALVEHDETRYAKVAPRFAGWVRQLHVNYTGAMVQKGQPLFTVYSPELFAAENEYLVSFRAVQVLKEGAPQAQKISAESLLESARLRMSLLQIAPEEIEELEKRGKPSAEMLFRAPFTGHVIVKQAVEGSAFQAGESLFEIADLSVVWLRAYVFEFEMPLVEFGQEATINFPYLNNKTIEGKVAFVYPHIEPQTRRGQIRIELENPGHLLRPDMWANIELKVQPGERLAVPTSAIINTGQRYVAFVNRPDGHLEPREVGVGMKTDDYYEVISGLNDGEQVAARALFLVDAESQLKAAIAGMGGSGHQH